MRNLMLVLAGLALTGSAYAADGVEWKHAGEVRVRHYNTTNETVIQKDATPAANSNEWKQRTKVSLTAMKGESFTGHVTLLNAQTWGRSTALSGGADTATDISQSTAKNLIMLSESYIWWKNSDTMSWRFGRGGMTLADGAVVSMNDYEQIPTVFDGVLGSFDLGFMGLNIFGVKGAEIGTGETPPAYQLAYDRESNFYGVSADFKNLPDVLKMANLHLIKEVQDPHRTSATAGTAGKDYLRYGLTLGGDTAGFDYKATYAGVTGKDRYFQNGTASGTAKDFDFKVDANMIDAAFGYSMPDMMGFHVGVTYHQDSGDKDGAQVVGSAANPEDTANGDKKNGRYDAFHYDKKKYAAQSRVSTPIIGWGNLTAIGLGVSLVPVENTTVGLGYNMYSRTSDKDTPNTTISHTATSETGVLGTGNNTEKALGNELNLTAEHRYSDAFDVNFRYSMFDPGAYFKKTQTSASASTEVKRDGLSQWFLQARLKF